MTSGLDVVTPVYVWKEIIAQFALAQKFLIYVICDDLFV